LGLVKEIPVQAKDDIKLALESNQDTLNGFLADLSDQDITVRQRFHPAIAWQMGHQIIAEVEMGAMVPAARYPELPAGMKEAYATKTGGAAPPAGYLKKAEYLEWFNKVRSATLAALDHLTNADLDKPTTGPMAQWAPSVGDLLLLMANHTALTINGLMTLSPAEV
jgi:hypothetical protein